MARALVGFIMLLATFAPAWVAGAQSLRVLDAGAERVLDRDALARAGGGRSELTVLEPHTGELRAYVGVDAAALLQAIYGDRWRRAGSLLFECADGYRALIEPSRFERHRALLGWGTADGAPFALRNRLQNDEAVELGPFYLVWDNRDDAALVAEGASGWPYQVVEIGLVDVAEALPRALPPAQAGAAARRGFEAFRTHCIACHSINGQGGAKAPELNIPSSVTEYLAAGWLQRWMLEPQRVRLNTTMPGLPGELPQREAVAADIEAYLRAMATHKQPVD